MRTFGWLVAMTVCACGTQSGTEKDGGASAGDEPCAEAAEVELALDEVSPLGFSGQDVLDWLSAGSTATLTWSDDATTAVTFGFAAGERGVHFADVEQNPDSESVCTAPDFLWVGVAYTLVTADGRLDEARDYVVRSVTGNDATLGGNTDGAGGPLDDCVNGEGGEQSFEAEFAPGGSTTGRLDCEGETTFELARW